MKKRYKNNLNSRDLNAFILRTRKNLVSSNEAKQIFCDIKKHIKNNKNCSPITVLGLTVLCVVMFYSKNKKFQDSILNYLIQLLESYVPKKLKKELLAELKFAETGLHNSLRKKLIRFLRRLIEKEPELMTPMLFDCLIMWAKKEEIEELMKKIMK